MAKSSKIDVNRMFLKAHKKAVQTAIETAARTRTLLVSREGDKVKMVKPTIKYLGYALVDTSVEVGYGSIYEQLGLKDYKEMQIKATLVMEITKAIKKKHLTQAAAAAILKISQPKLSGLLHGRFRGYSVERLIHFLTELGKDVDIVVRAKPRNRKARVNVYYSHKSRSDVGMVAKGR